MSIIILISSIVLLLILIAIGKLNAFISLIITALYVGLAIGMPLTDVVKSVQNGVGSTLGSLVMILGFGVILGSLLAESGAAQRISSGLIQFFGVKYTKLAMVLTGFSVGLAMFYNAGFIILIPLIFSVAQSTGLNVIYVGLATASALSVTHGFLPPHPGPTAIAIIFKANIGKTILYGLVVAIPILAVAGLIFPEFVKNFKSNPPKGLFDDKVFTDEEMPGFGLSLLAALIPVLLMAVATICELSLPEENPTRKFFKFLGDPSITMLISVLFAIVFLGLMRGKSMESLMAKASTAVSAAAMMLLIIGGGGAFKQVLIDSGIGKDIAALFAGTSLSPLLLAWLIATILRISLGSATVAGLTAAGIVQPLIASTGVKPELMVLAIGAGSMMCSHVNDTGFWIFKEYFGLSLADTFRTWTVLETIVGVMGLISVLLLNLVV